MFCLICMVYMLMPSHQFVPTGPRLQPSLNNEVVWMSIFLGEGKERCHV